MGIEGLHNIQPGLENLDNDTSGRAIEKSDGLVTPGKMMDRLETAINPDGKDRGSEFSIIHSQQLKQELSVLLRNIDQKDSSAEPGEKNIDTMPLRQQVIVSIEATLPYVKEAIEKTPRIINILNKIKDQKSAPEFQNRIVALESVFSDSLPLVELQQIFSSELAALKAGRSEEFCDLYSSEKELLGDMQRTLKNFNTSALEQDFQADQSLQNKFKELFHALVSGPLFVSLLGLYELKPSGRITEKQEMENADSSLGWMRKMAPADAKQYFEGLPAKIQRQITVRMDELREQPYEFMKKEKNRPVARKVATDGI